MCADSDSRSDIQRFYVQAECAAGLDGVGVERHLVGAGDGADLGDRLNSAHLVVGVHDADQRRVGPDGLFHRSGVHQAVAVHRHVGHVKAKVLLQLLDGVADGVVLDGRGDDVVLLGAVAPLKGHAAQGQVVALGAATGKDDLVGRAAQDVGHRLAGLIHGVVRLASHAIDARGLP